MHWMASSLLAFACSIMLLGVDDAAKVQIFPDPSKNLWQLLRTFNNHLPSWKMLLEVSRARRERSERASRVSGVCGHVRALPVRTL